MHKTALVVSPLHSAPKAELAVAFAAATTATLLNPLVGVAAFVALVGGCTAANAFGAQLVGSDYAAPRLTLMYAPAAVSPAQPARPAPAVRVRPAPVARLRVADDIPSRLLRRADEGDAIAGSYLRILAALFPEQDSVTEPAAMLDLRTPASIGA